jgi:hypothetical protein
MGIREYMENAAIADRKNMFFTPSALLELTNNKSYFCLIGME